MKGIFRWPLVDGGYVGVRQVRIILVIYLIVRNNRLTVILFTKFSARFRAQATQIGRRKA